MKRLLSYISVLLCTLMWSSASVSAVDLVQHSVSRGEGWSSISRKYKCPSGDYATAWRFLCEYNHKMKNPLFKKAKGTCEGLDRGMNGPMLKADIHSLWIPPQCSKTYPQLHEVTPNTVMTRKKVKRRKKCTGCNWTQADFNRTKGQLKRAMKERGFKAPKNFRATIVKTSLKNRKVTTEKGSKSVAVVEHHEVYDYGGNGMDYKRWNPASTVKIYSAVAAIARIKQWGFPISHPESLNLTFHEKRKDRSFDLNYLFEAAAHISKNHPHNRLALLAGFDFINGDKGILKRGAGLDFSYLTRGYELGKWRAMGNSASLKDSPAITIKSGGKVKKLKERKGSFKSPCYSSACTSLSDLSKFLCTLMLHEQLPRSERITELDNNECSRKRSQYCIKQGKHLQFVRTFLNRKRDGRKDPVWNILADAFGVESPSDGESHRGETQIFRKSGWARKWASDVLYIYLPQDRPNERWLVAMACYGNRYCLGKGKNSAAEVIADIIIQDDLSPGK